MNMYMMVSIKTIFPMQTPQDKNMQTLYNWDKNRAIIFAYNMLLKLYSYSQINDLKDTDSSHIDSYMTNFF